MRQELFNSRNISDIAEEIWINWDENERGPRPKSFTDEQIWNEAWDYIADDYRYIQHEFCTNTPGTKVLLVGYLGLWNGQRFAYKVTDTKHAFDCPYDDLSIVYEDGDIWIDQYHHDGINTLRVLGLKEIYDFNNTGMSDEEYEDIDEFLCMLRDNCEMTEELMIKYLPTVTYSVASYLKDFLSKESLEDLEKYNELVGGNA